jgi:hypothetical protein
MMNEVNFTSPPRALDPAVANQSQGRGDQTAGTTWSLGKGFDYGSYPALTGIGGNTVASDLRLAAAPPAPPAPSPLSQENLNKFINEHTRYNGGPATAYTSEIRQFLEKQGGDVYVQKLLQKFPNSMLDITSSYDGVAASSGGNTVFSKAFWDANPGSRVAVLMHEYMHHIDDGKSVESFFNAAKANPAKQWDSYAMTSPAEYIASGFEWIVGNQPYSATESKREAMYRIDPDFYNYMVNTFIPNFYR